MSLAALGALTSGQTRTVRFPGHSRFTDAAAEARRAFGQVSRATREEAGGDRDPARPVPKSPIPYVGQGEGTDTSGNRPSRYPQEGARPKPHAPHHRPHSRHHGRSVPRARTRHSPAASGLGDAQSSGKCSPPRLPQKLLEVVSCFASGSSAGASGKCSPARPRRLRGKRPQGSGVKPEVTQKDVESRGIPSRRK